MSKFLTSHVAPRSQFVGLFPIAFRYMVVTESDAVVIGQVFVSNVIRLTNWNIRFCCVAVSTSVFLTNACFLSSEVRSETGGM